MPIFLCIISINGPGCGLTWPKIFLPLGISFYTFQSIAYLADCKEGKVGRHSMLDFAVFLHFFPQLIAGPIVHHREMLAAVPLAADVRH